MSKTLYVSDLDGTLLNSRQLLSEFTEKSLNRLKSDGIYFTYATARSLITAKKATTGFNPAIPVIVYNGSFIMECESGRILHSGAFERADAVKVLDTLIKHDVYPNVYSFVEGTEKFSYSREHMSKGLSDFVDTRKDDPRNNPVSVNKLYDGDIFYFSCIDDKEKLEPLYHIFKDSFRCIFHKDIYSGEQWLEILPKAASKASAVLKLKHMLGCDKVVCFGDAVNDIPMFEAADECYAVENAHEALKKIATGVIGSNNDDGVVKWLICNACRCQE